MSFLKKLFKNKENHLFRLKNCELIKDHDEEVSIRNKRFGYLGYMEIDTPYFNIKKFSILHRYHNYDGKRISEKIIHGYADLHPGRIFWFNEGRGEIANNLGRRYPSSDLPTVTFKKSEYSKATFLPNHFSCCIENDCFEELSKLIENNNIATAFLQFSNEKVNGFDDTWHYLRFNEKNKLQLPTGSMWGISEKNNWEAFPDLSFESKTI